MGLAQSAGEAVASGGECSTECNDWVSSMGVSRRSFFVPSIHRPARKLKNSFTTCARAQKCLTATSVSDSANCVCADTAITEMGTCGDCLGGENKDGAGCESPSPESLRAVSDMRHDTELIPFPIAQPCQSFAPSTLPSLAVAVPRIRRRRRPRARLRRPSRPPLRPLPPSRQPPRRRSLRPNRLLRRSPRRRLRVLLARRRRELASSRLGARRSSQPERRSLSRSRAPPWA